MESERERRKKYDEIAKFCKECKAYKPRTKNQCKVYQLLLCDMQPDMVRNEHCFLKDGVECKGYVWNG